MKPQTLPDFSWIKLNPKLYMKRAKEALQNRQEVINSVKTIPASGRTFANTAVALEYGEHTLGLAFGWLGLLMNVRPDKSGREAAKEAVDYIEAAAIEMEFDEGIFKALKELENKKPKLVGEDKKLFVDMMRSYRRMGFELPKSKRTQVKSYAKQLAKLSSDFRKNINDYQNFILATKQELEGLPENYIKSLRTKNGKYVISLDYPEYVPFMENAHNEAKREELSNKYLKKGGKKNMAILEKMVLVRDKAAKLLGYKNHAHYVLEVRMAKSPEVVKKFLRNLSLPLKPKVLAELKQLEQVKREFSNNPNANLKYHDILFAITQDKRLRLNVDEQEVRQYFPLEIVTKGMMEIYQKLFQVKFRKLSGLPIWQKDVQTFSVSEAETGELLAYFFLDLHPREGKYGHAAVFPIVPGFITEEGGYNKPVVSMVTNFPKSTKTNPSLLSHDEVVTYFHEFGHVVHGVLTKAKYSSQSGTSVQRDFVEAPSQMLENWVWDEKVLSVLSGHHANSKKKLPKQLLKSLVAAKDYMVAYTSMRQLTFGTFDIILHTEKPGQDIAKLYAKLVKELVGLDLPKDQLFPAGFGHLDGYDAGYYGYMWSKVFASDMFTRFNKERLLNPKTGQDYREHILEPGSSREALDLIESFLGRPPNNKAFLKEIGVN